jgi:hypothetical protein
MLANERPLGDATEYGHSSLPVAVPAPHFTAISELSGISPHTRFKHIPCLGGGRLAG